MRFEIFSKAKTKEMCVCVCVWGGGGVGEEKYSDKNDLTVFGLFFYSPTTH
jgi:hypothetical protein